MKYGSGRKKFDDFLKDFVKKRHLNLIENSRSQKDYCEFLEEYCCSVLLLNRRVGKLQRVTVSDFVTNYKTTSFSVEFEKALSPAETIICHILERIVIRGKHGRGVSVLFDQQMIEWLEYAISLRKNFEFGDNVYLFGIPRTTNSIYGYVVMRKLAKIALGSYEKGSLLMSTKLRKHLATIAQIFALKKSGLE